MVIVLMGVSGSGKSTTGLRLAELLGWPFRDADSFHPPANIAKMRRGIALQDSDRWPWLDAIAAWIDAQLEARPIRVGVLFGPEAQLPPSARSRSHGRAAGVFAGQF